LTEWQACRRTQERPSRESFMLLLKIEGECAMAVNNSATASRFAGQIQIQDPY